MSSTTRTWLKARRPPAHYPLSSVRRRWHSAPFLPQPWGSQCHFPRVCTQARWLLMPAPPIPPPPPAPASPTLPSTAHSHVNSLPPPQTSASTWRDGSVFATALQRAHDDVADSLHLERQTSSAELPSFSSSSPQLSPWLQYLVGLRHEPPRAGKAHRTSQAATTSSNADNVFLHHVFHNAAEATLFVRVRQPMEFLRPESAEGGQPHTPAHDDLRPTDDTAQGWALASFGSVLPRLERVLHEMARRELAKTNDAAMRDEHGASRKAEFLLSFWRAMLEQAFLEQYCEVSALQVEGNAAERKQTHSICSSRNDSSGRDGHVWVRTVFDLYPYDYRSQPRELRRRLEQCIRALLCASAFTFHAQWEQYMARHKPADTVAHVLGLELALLWWYANPDQLPVELTSSVHRLPPCTLRQQARLAGAGGGDGGGDIGGRHSLLQRPSTTASENAVPVEHHLREFMKAHVAATNQETRKSAQPHASCRAGGFLCPAAMFPPSYRNALRAHLCRVRHHKDLVTCPLFVRLLEVAVMVSSTVPQSWVEDEATSAQSVKLAYLQSAARRGREVAQYLVGDWLWSVVCTAAPTTSAAYQGLSYTPLPSVHELLHPAAPCGASPPASALNTTPLAVERAEDWALLVAVVTAVAQVRGHMLALRRGMRARHHVKVTTAPTSSNGGEGDASTGDGAESVAYVRDHLYTSAMRVLLCLSPTEAYRVEGLKEENIPFPHAGAELPSWVYLVFANVFFCFQDCGWLHHSVAHQPATPARLWGELFRTLCDAFPNVFHAGNTVTVLLTLWSMEGTAAAPSTYHSTLQQLSKGRVEATRAWVDVVARTQASLAFLNSPKETGTVELTAEGRETEDDVGEAQEELAVKWLWSASGALCPRAEQRQRSAYVAETSSDDPRQPQFESASTTASPKEDIAAAGAGARSGCRTSRRGSRWSDMQLSYASSFACPLPSPPPPQHVSSEAARSQMYAHLTSCEELTEEVTSTAAQIFRQYAALPTLRAVGVAAGVTITGGCDVAATSQLSSEEVARMRRTGQPSFFVLLKLLHSVAVFGDTFTSERKGGVRNPSDVPGLVSSVVRDVEASCHPVVASYLHKMRVYSASVSGKDGALALLFDDELQSQLNSLPPQLGRRRLVVALLWSGLPASTLTEVQGDDERREDNAQQCADVADSVFGSGSLAWCVLGSNQQHFFSTRPLLFPASASDATEHAESAESSAAAPFANTAAAVCGLLEEVVKHLWQLAIAVPEPARVLLHLYPHMRACVVAPGAENARDDLRSAAATACDAMEDLPQGVRNGKETEATDTNTSSSTEVEDRDGDDVDEVRSSTPSYWNDESAEDGEAVTEAVPYVMDDAALSAGMLESAADNGGWSGQWNSQDTLKAFSATSPNEQVDALPCTDSAETVREAEVPLHDRMSIARADASCRAVVAALRPALYHSQHLFFSLMEVLAWVANAQRSREALETLTERIHSDASTDFKELVGHAAWSAQLASYYNLCVSVWAGRAAVRHEGKEDKLPSNVSAAQVKEGNVLLQPKLMEQVFLVLCQTCPDVYLLSLLLLNLSVREAEGPITSSTVQAFLTHRWERATSLFSWSVECAVAQLLYHAGVTSASVLRWRAPAADAVLSDQDGEAAVLTHVMVHHDLLTTLTASQKPGRDSVVASSSGRKEEAAPLCFFTNPPPPRVQNARRTLAATEHQLVMSIGSLLLSSLHLRFRGSTRHRSAYRYNFYINEFLANSLPGLTAAGKTDISYLRAVLPSMQVTSRSPSAGPPQQLVSLRQVWQEDLNGTQRNLLRGCFRGKCNEAAPHAQPRVETPSTHHLAKASCSNSQMLTDSEREYVGAFI